MSDTPSENEVDEVEQVEQVEAYSPQDLAADGEDVVDGLEEDAVDESS